MPDPGGGGDGYPDQLEKRGRGRCPEIFFQFGLTISGGGGGGGEGAKKF